MKRIFVSAGHSNTDPGVVGGGTTEAAIVTRMRNLVVAELRRQGATVISDGDGGINLPLGNAIELARTVALARTSAGPRVEFHMNGAANPAATGTECLSLPAQKALAQAIAAAVARVTGLRLRGEAGWVPESASARGRLGFLRQANGVVVELGFHTNPNDRNLVIQRMPEIAKVIADVLIAEARK